MKRPDFKSCVVVTYFVEGQPGFLDFSYRIKSLARNSRLTVVSNFPLTQIELYEPSIEYVVIESGHGRLNWLLYLFRSALLIRDRSPSLVVALASMTSPLSLLVGGTPTVTYWNEHPSHAAPKVPNFSPILSGVRGVTRWLMFRGACQSSLVMPIGEAHRDDLIEHGCNPIKIRMLYMGVDQSFSCVAKAVKKEISDEPINLIYVGSVQKDRGRDVMLEAMALANSLARIAHLTIVGASDEQLKYCQNYVKELGIENSVTLHGRVPGHLIPDYLGRADAGLCLWEDLPWYRFNPPTKLFEYLVAGLPVLASNIRTHTEYVQNGFNGLIFEYGSVGLANAITQLHQSRDQLLSMSCRACESSAAYHWKTIEPEFIAAISKATL